MESTNLYFTYFNFRQHSFLIHLYFIFIELNLFHFLFKYVFLRIKPTDLNKYFILFIIQSKKKG